MKKFVLGIVLAGLLAAPSVASAIGYSTAFNLTWNRNINQCNNRNSEFYYCQHPNYPFAPVCQATGINISGRAQWICTSSFTQGGRFSIVKPRLCNLTDKWGPYGGLVGESASCHESGGQGAGDRPGRHRRR